MEIVCSPARTKSTSRYICAVKGCSSKSNKNLDLFFHTFPKSGGNVVKIESTIGNFEKLDRLEAWKRALQLQDVTPRMRVCSLHFNESDYILPYFKLQRKKLKNTSVPSRNLQCNETTNKTKLNNARPKRKTKKNNKKETKNKRKEEDPLEILDDAGIYNIPPECSKDNKDVETSQVQQVNKSFNDFGQQQVETEFVDFIKKEKDTPTCLALTNAFDINGKKSFSELTTPHKNETVNAANTCSNEIYIKEEIIEETYCINIKLENDSTADECQNEANCNIKFEDLPTTNSFMCNICFRTFNRCSSLRNHEKVHARQKKLECQICKMSFTRNTHLNVPYKCNMCQLAFAHMNTLRKHERMHAKEKSYVCNICSKTFVQRTDYVVHKRTHTAVDTKPYKCDSCDMLFKKFSYLIVHKQTHTGEKPYTCTVCVKSFGSSGSWKDHERLHTGDKPYKCDVKYVKYRSRTGPICGGINEFTQEFEFNKSDYLKLHERIHTGVKPFSCNVCQLTFNRKDTLNRHQRNHAAKKVYKCHTCLMPFGNRQSLQTHECKNVGEQL